MFQVAFFVICDKITKAYVFERDLIFCNMQITNCALTTLNTSKVVYACLNQCPYLYLIKQLRYFVLKQQHNTKQTTLCFFNI